MKVFLDMVGCRLNQSELENIARQFRLAGHTLASDAASADMVVINTCTVTSAAASDSRQKIHQAARAGVGQIIATGCWATLNAQQAANLPGVSQVITNQKKDRLVPLVLGLPEDGIVSRSIDRQPIPGSRLRTRAFIKVQDGCDNYCTYCITRIARGAGKSREIPSILADIHAALEGGTQEIVLTGVHLGSWGYDLASPSHLSHLVSTILCETDAPRIRISSIEPWDISADFFQLWQNPRLCRHLHLPLQSGSEATLKRMRRRVSPQSFAALIRTARYIIPDVAISTDLITGFPGESEAEFSESAAFVTAMDFAHGHVFSYSARPGTPAAHLPDQIPHLIAKERNAHMREILHSSNNAYLKKHLGHNLLVLWEKAIPVNGDQWLLSGLTDNYLRVTAFSSAPCHNHIMNVHITGVKQGGLFGEILGNGSQRVGPEHKI